VTEPGPPTLATIEYLWSRSDAVQHMLERSMAAAIATHGGFAPVLEAGWWDLGTVELELDLERDDQGRPLGEAIAWKPVYRDGKRIGYQAPDARRAEWEAPPERSTPRPVDVLTASLEALYEELESAGVLLAAEPVLETRLRSAYAIDAPATSIAVRSSLASPNVRKPAALLMKRLAHIVTRT